MADRSPNPSPCTIGYLEEQAGIGPTHAERFDFWKPFAPLEDAAFAAAVAELKRMAKERAA